MLADVNIRNATLSDLDTLTQLERGSYPPDEAASRQVLQLRIESAPECTIVGELGSKVIGFVCGTRSTDTTLTARSMKEHVDDGVSLCIHSVVVDASLRRQGHALRLLRAYEAHARTLQPSPQRLLLIAKANLVSLYEKASYQNLGSSLVTHGTDPWFELGIEL